MATFPGCCVPSSNGAEAVTTTRNGGEVAGVMANKVCGQDLFPYILTDTALGSVNLYGQTVPVVLTESAVGSVNLYGTSNAVILTGGEM